MLGLGQGRSAAARQLAGDISGVGTGIAGIGANLAGYGSQLGDLGATQQRLRAQDIGLLEGLGQTERGIEQQRLDRQYAQQQATRMAPTQAASYIQGFAPAYQSGQTQIDKTYGLPVDPRNAALAAGLGVYNTFRPQQQQPTNTTDSARAYFQEQLSGLQKGLGNALNPPIESNPYQQPNPYQQQNPYQASYGAPGVGQGYAPPGTNSNYYNQFGVGP